MKKKVVIILSSALLIITATVLTTFAFLKDEKVVVNTFSVGNVSIKLDETDVDANGVAIPGAARVIENEYHLLPGKTYVKDPLVTVKAGSQTSYVRMIVTINHITEIKAIFGEDFMPGDFVSGYDQEKWIYIGSEDNILNNSTTYEFRYYKTVNGYEESEAKDIKLEPLFETFTLPGEITGEQLNTIKDLKIVVIAHAMQANGFENDEEAAWETFENSIE